jgi:uncharacterized protein DUF3311
MAQPRSQRTHAYSPAHRTIWVIVAVLLAATLAGTLWVPFYNHTTPSLGGFPFFYWYQLAWVPAVAVLSAISYLLSRRAQGGRAAAPPAAGAGHDGTGAEGVR